METVSNRFVERLFCSGFRPSFQDRRNRVTRLTPAGYARLAQSDKLWENARRGFEAGFGRLKSESLREAMQFLVSGEFVSAFEKTIAKGSTLWTQ